MRFIGNKARLVDKIYQFILDKNIEGNSIFDFFAGTTNVSKFFKKQGYKIYSSDLLYFSYVLQQAYIVNNEEIKFESLIPNIDRNSELLFSTPIIKIVEYLNSIPLKKGFIYKNYTPSGTKHLPQPRMYFSDYNGKKIDGIRKEIENWNNNKKITEQEYYILLACLIESVPFYANISGVYAAFQKKWDPRAVKEFQLRPIPILKGHYKNSAYNQNSTDLLNIKADIYYLDPPYNQRQYAPNYHLLETIAKYDNPKIKGVTGMRNYDKQKSKFCNAKTAVCELDKIANDGNFKNLILSYNSEGIMKKKDIISVLEEYGKVEYSEIAYPRFKSNNKGESKNKKLIKEQLYLLRKYE